MEKIPFILIGLKEECDEFEKFAVSIADLIMSKPLNNQVKSGQSFYFLEN